MHWYLPKRIWGDFMLVIDTLPENSVSKSWPGAENFKYSHNLGESKVASAMPIRRLKSSRNFIRIVKKSDGTSQNGDLESSPFWVEKPSYREKPKLTGARFVVKHIVKFCLKISAIATQ